MLDDLEFLENYLKNLEYPVEKVLEYLVFLEYLDYFEHLENQWFLEILEHLDYFEHLGFLGNC